MRLSYRTCFEKDIAKFEGMDPRIRAKVEALLGQLDDVRNCLQDVESTITRMGRERPGSALHQAARRVELPCLGTLEARAVEAVEAVLGLAIQWREVDDPKARAAVEGVAGCLAGIFGATEDLVEELRGDGCSEDTSN